MFEPSPALLQVWQAWQTVQDALDRGDCRGRSTHEVEAWARRAEQEWVVPCLKRFLAGGKLDDLPRLVLLAYREELETAPEHLAARLWAKCQIEAGQIPSLPPEPWQTEVKRKLG